MRVIQKIGVIILVLGCSVSLAKEPVFPGLGSYHRRVSTNSKLAQRYFDQGLNFLFGFNHDEAIRSFTQATEEDPKCAMAWWGIANANGPHINNPTVDEAHAKAAILAISKGLEPDMRANPVEKALLLATKERFSGGNDRTAQDRAFATQMRDAWKRFPRDPDVGALFAEALMDLSPWDYWKKDGTPQPWVDEIEKVLKSVLKQRSMHPLALHLFIHLKEAGPNPKDAKFAADRLRNLQPGLGHMVHMPSHIDVRLGEWQDAIAANTKAIAADEAYRKSRPFQGFYRIYMAHNRHMLAYAAMMVGQSELAIQEIDKMVAQMPKDWVKEMGSFADGYVVMPLEVRLRFGKWEEILGQPDYPEYLPISRAIRHAARAIAFAATGRVDEAKLEQLKFASKRQNMADAPFGNNGALAIMNVAEHLMNGEVLFAQRNFDAAILELREAVIFEDALRYDEPPDWIQPTRHALGAVLMALGRHKEAQKVYLDDLVKLPNNGWSLFGLAKTLELSGEQKEADKVRKQFEKIWSKADMKINSSCLCLQAKDGLDEQ